MSDNPTSSPAGEPPHATISEAEGILTVMINRPKKLNAISPEVTAALWEAATLLSERTDLRCMVITATGKYFTVGIDLAATRAKHDSRPADWDVHGSWNYRRDYRQHHLLYDEFETIEKPIILAAQATCLGAGTEMAVSCDFRFCTPETEWALPEIQLGVISGSGGSSRLTRIVGVAWAKWIAMAGKRVGAEQAKTIGLVHDVFPAETFMDEVYAFCRELCKIPHDALGTAKLAIDIAGDVPDRGVMRHFDRVANQGLVEGPEFKRRTQAFYK